jgi:putative GTP pyrophosphokinase
MSEIRGDIMNAQAMYQMKSIAMRDTLNRIQELYDLGETHKAMQYQRRLDKTQQEHDITYILELKREIDRLLEQYRIDGIDGKTSE